MTIRRRVRQAQTVVPFGVGAIFELQGESFVATDVRGWDSRKTLTAPRLAQAMKVRGFASAPPARESDFDVTDAPGIPYMRFPAWLFCGSCRRLTRWNRDDERPGKVPECRFCSRGSLTPMRFVQVCANGHLGDIDWWYWAHADDPEKREACSRDATLRYVADSSSTGLEALHVTCVCGASRDLLSVLRPGALKEIGVRCDGRQPWQRRDEAEKDCESTPTVVQRGASNVYYPDVWSALDIPQDAPGDDLGVSDEVLERIRNHQVWPDVLADPDSPTAARFAEFVIAPEVDVDADVILSLARRESIGEAGLSTPDPAVLGPDEWRAFTTAGSAGPQSPNFVTRTVPLVHGDPARRISRALDGRVRQVVIADRLREVRALRGFRRLSPDGPLIGVDPTKVSPWLPAVETFGEGLFIAFDEARIARWEGEEQVRRRTARLSVPVAPRYVLLHTLAHLLIRQLAFDCGYGAASLRERIYASAAGDRQAGLLIYTSAGDAEGTLGGLAQRGMDGRLAETMIRLLEAAAWCSADPLCAEHAPTGMVRNLAACHGCALVPETSCEARNSRLDRLLVVGGDPVPGFFAEVIEESRGMAAAAIEDTDT